MNDERPDALLKSALEKIVYFEARSEQLVRDLASTSSEVGRLKQELAAAAQREIELRRTVASLEVELGRTRREREELGRINDALRGERAALIEKMLEASRIHGPGPVDDDTPFDLASFIAQLRSEVLSHSGGPAARSPPAAPGDLRRAEARPAEMPVAEVRVSGEAPESRIGRGVMTAAAAIERDVSAPEEARELSSARPDEALAAHAERFRAEGRLQVSSADVAKLAGSTSFPGRVEETLFGFSVRELSAPDPMARQRAAERLRALGQVAAAPALASALHEEREPRVQVSLLQAFAEVATQEGAAVVRPLLDAPSADVRIAALKALLELDPTQAAPHLSAAMRDVDRAVRRRASLMALSLAGDAALALGEQAMRDADADVRSLGALVLGARAGDRARALLLSAMRDSEKKVRRAAAQSLSRLLGEDVSNVVELDEASRRREVRRLGTLPLKPVRAPQEAVTRAAPVAIPAPSPAPGVNAPGAARVSQKRIAVDAQEPTREPQPTGALAGVHTGARIAVAVAPVAAEVMGAPRQGSEALCSAISGELRISLRGRSIAELSAITGENQAGVLDACELLSARGQAVRRGNKFFAA